MFKKQKDTIFACFSPPVMIATFAIEVISMIYVLFRYKLNAKSRLVALLLLNLALFQLAEFMVCENSSVAIISSRIGYAAITLLPALGLHLTLKITGANKNNIIKLIYALSVFFCAYFLFSPTAFDGYACTGNYVIFQIGNFETLIYSIYYFGIILATLIYCISKRTTLKSRDKKALSWLMIGYLSFILPAAIFITFNPDSKQALPSVLCGFAILLALVLVSKISPLILKKRKL